MSTPAIAIQGLTVRYGKNAVVDNLRLDVPQGTVCGLLGRNGAGKTTTIHVLMNRLKATAGGVRVLGLDPVEDAVEGFAADAGRGRPAAVDSSGVRR